MELLKNISLTIILIGFILSIIIPLLVEITKNSEIIKIIKDLKNINSYIDNIWVVIMCLGMYLLSIGISGYLFFYIWIVK